jgi:four helix bundle protein
MENMVLYQRLVDFAEWLFPAVDRFPRREKFALCTQIKNSMYALIRLSIRAQKSARDKHRYLHDLDVELQMLKFLLRHAHRLQYLDTRRYESAGRKLMEIGKIVGGLLKAFSGKRG